MKKMGMFSKILSINIVSMLLCIMIMGATQMVLLTNYISRYSENYLYRNAEAIINMIEGNLPMESLRSLVSGISKVSGSYIIIYDTNGKVIVSSESNQFTNRTPAYIAPECSKSVLSGQKSSSIGTMNGLFTTTMFTLQMPIKNKGNDVVGAVSMSRPIPEHQRMQYELFRILIMSIAVLSAMSIALSYLLARSISVPIKKISNSTKEFAKGNFDVRVEASAQNSSVAEISELAEAFNHMAEELEKAEEIKNTFISDVSHELRTPMTTIGGFVSGMLDGTIPEDKYEKYLNIVYSEINRLSRLVNTFLDITRMQSDKLALNMTDFDINEVIRIVVIGLEAKIEEKQIDIVLAFEAEKCYVNADKDSITRVLTNLIDNAVKFTNQNGNITISVSQKGHEIITSVKNTGCGISEEQRSMIFKRFYKVDKSRAINRDGVGIGLYLVQNILATHGKEISLDSVEGEYAQFTFALNKSKQSHVKSIN